MKSRSNADKKGPVNPGLFYFIFVLMKDNFSVKADLYARYRPRYPARLFDFILDQVKERNQAWDCATGNGQTALELAKHFKMVSATDISGKQLENAVQTSNIFYSLQPAEQTNFPDNNFDLITVSQALHWFDFDKFYNETKRTAKKKAWIAAWMYALLKISPGIDELIHAHHYGTLEKHWDKERKFVDLNYTSIPFPFDEITCPSFQIEYAWTIDELEGYLNTWSALQKFITDKGYNPVDELIGRIKPLWTTTAMKVIFPVYMRMGKINK